MRVVSEVSSHITNCVTVRVHMCCSKDAKVKFDTYAKIFSK